MSEPVVVIEVQRLVETRTFMEGARAHVDGLTGYVRSFLKKNEGLLNENGRAWTVESCADALKIPGKTLRRWMGDIEVADQQEPTAFLPEPRPVVTRRSNAKHALIEPDERRAVLEALPPETRDELRADLIDLDLPTTTQCRHCREHCPQEGRT